MYIGYAEKNRKLLSIYSKNVTQFVLCCIRDRKKVNRNTEYSKLYDDASSPPVNENWLILHSLFYFTFTLVLCYDWCVSNSNKKNEFTIRRMQKTAFNIKNVTFGCHYHFEYYSSPSFPPIFIISSYQQSTLYLILQIFHYRCQKLNLFHFQLEITLVPPTYTNTPVLILFS